MVEVYSHASDRDPFTAGHVGGQNERHAAAAALLRARRAFAEADYPSRGCLPSRNGLVAGPFWDHIACEAILETPQLNWPTRREVCR
jgi:hypothetical protein